MSAMRTLSLEPGMATESWWAEFALRSLVSRSATGSVIVIMTLLSRLVSPSRSGLATWVVAGGRPYGRPPRLDYLVVLPEREAERLKQRATLVIGLCGGHDSDVEPTHPINLILIDLVEHTLLLKTEGVVAVSVELL